MELENLRTQAADRIVPEAEQGIQRLFDTALTKVNCMNNMVMKRDKSLAQQEDQLAS